MEVYLDNAATTKPIPEAVTAAVRAMEKDWYNPSAIYEPARKVKQQIEEVRHLVAQEIGALDNDIIFTSGASESNSIVQKMGTIITSTVEHPSINNAAIFNIIGVDKYGKFDFSDVNEEIFLKSKFVSFQHANNEIGTIQNIPKTIREIRKLSYWKPLIHVDATQTFGVIPIDVYNLGIDMLSASAHKFGGIKGCGILYANREAQSYLRTMIYGEQERKLRGGTYNVPGILAMGEAIRQINYDKSHMIELRDKFIGSILETVPHSYLVGDPKDRLPNNINICFHGYSADVLVNLLSEREIYVSAGSACSSNNVTPSHVLKAIGIPEEDLRSCIRFSLGNDTTIDRIEYVVRNLREIVYTIGVQE